MPLIADRPPAPALAKGAELELLIDKLAFGGKAMGRVGGFVVFVDHALPGQKVKVRLTRKKAQFAEARVLEVLTPSPAQVAPFCSHFGLCGGCQWQDLTYEAQLNWKGVQVAECLRHLGGLSPGVILPPVASPALTCYRNKMEFTFAPRAWLPAPEFAAAPPAAAPLALGLHVKGGFDRVFNLTECYLESPQTPALVQEVRTWCRQSGLPAYTTRTHQGFWRFLILREGKRTSQTLAHLITSSQGDPAAVDALGGRLLDRFPALTTMVHSLSETKAQVAVGEASRTLWGPGYIEEELLGLRFRISAHSFFQTNPGAAEILYGALRRLGEFSGRETVWDLYCGAGSIAVTLAAQVEQVLGFELVPEAIADAHLNCRLNGVDNCRFLAGDLKERLKEALGAPHLYPRPDVVVTDPPRAGMHPQVVQALLTLAPRQILAVSCNPATLARDLALLKEHYEVASLQPFDLFPHTSHIECLASLKRRPG
jgi:23S rRNA (uracil1939-C5)-methyltransferase